MALHLITGSANTGKTGFIYSRMREALAEGRRPILVVPSAPDAERALSELARDYPVGVRVLTFAGFSAQMWDQHGDGREILGRSQRELLCLAAAHEVDGTGGIARLATSCVERLAESTGGAWRKGRHAEVPAEAVTLAATIARYAELLSEHDLVEPAEAAWLLADRVPNDGPPLLVHRFADFTPSQVRLIRRWAEHGEVHVSLTWQAGFAPTIASSELMERLGPAVIHVAEETPKTDSTLLSLGRSLFGEPDRLEEGSAVRFSLAEGASAEAQRIAEEAAVALLEETASSAEDIAVVFGDVEAHYPALRQAFVEAGIAADFDVEVPFTQTPFGSAVSHLLGFALGGGRSDLLALVRSRFSGIERDDARRLETLWRGEGLDDREALLRRVAAVDRRLGDVLATWVSAAKAPVSAERAAALAGSARSLYALAYRSDHPRSGTRAEQDAWAHHAVMTILSEVALLAPGRVGLADVRELLGLQSMRPKESERAGHVQVMPLSRIRGRRFETVIIGGLNAGEIPRAPREDALPGSAVHTVLVAFGGGEDEPKGIEYEQLAFYLAVTRARKRLVLSAQVTDSDGEPRELSPFLQVVCDSFRAPDEEADWPNHEFRAASQPPSSDAREGSRELERALVYHGDETAMRARASRRRAAPRRATLVDPRLLEAMADREVFSASEIESYLSCPYSWFYGYRVRPRELERMIGPAEQGSFAHALLEKTYVRMLDSGTERVTQRTLAGALCVLDEVYGEVSTGAGVPANVREAIDRQAARQWAARILADDAARFPGFRPMHLEWKFGFDDERVMVGSFALRGRVDRIDVDDNGRAVVIDYKRSGAPTARDITGRGKVQMPLYLTVVERELGLRPVAGLYRALSKRQDRGLVMSEALPDDSFVSTDVLGETAFRELIAEGLALAEGAVEGMRAGRIDCEPSSRASCGYCGAALFCGGAR